MIFVLFAGLWLGAFVHFEGDFAVLELYTRNAAEGRQLVGPYSRFGWHHPGPSYFYLLAPLYLLSGGASWSLFVSAWVLAMVCALLILRAYWQLEESASARLIFLLIFSLFSFAHGLQTTSVFIWNPSVTVLPFVLLQFACVLVARGRLSWLPLAVIAHAFVVQTHIAYAPTATAALLLGLMIWYRDRGTRVGSASSQRPWLLALGVFCVLWFSPILEQLTSEPGNFSQLLSFFATSGEPRPELGELAGSALAQLALPLLAPGLWLAGQSAPIWLSALASLALICCLALGLRREAREGGWHRSLVFVAAAQLSLGCLSLAGLRGPVMYYLILWLCGLSFVAWASLSVWLSRRRLAERLLRSGLSVPALVALLAVGSTVQAWRALSEARYWSQRRASVVAAIVDTTRALVREGDSGELVLKIGAHDTWGYAAGAILSLYKRGVEIAVDPGWETMFHRGVRYREQAARELWIFDGHDNRTLPLVEVDGVHLGLESEDHETFRGPILDDRDERAEHLAFSMPAAAVGLKLWAEDSRDLSLSGSMDGTHFFALGQVRVGRAPVDFFYSPSRGWAHLRVSAETPVDGLHVSALVSRIREKRPRITETSMVTGSLRARSMAVHPMREKLREKMSSDSRGLRALSSSRPRVPVF